jgi:hypothetical protein
VAVLVGSRVRLGTGVKLAVGRGVGLLVGWLVGLMNRLAVWLGVPVSEAGFERQPPRKRDKARNAMRQRESLFTA